MNKKYHKTYREQHHEKFLQYMKKYRETHKEQLRQYRRNVYIQNKALLETIFGKECFVCGDKGKFRLHNIYGKPHVNYGGCSHAKYYIEHKEEFVRLCVKHHNLVHQLNPNNPNLEKLLKLASLLNNPL